MAANAGVAYRYVLLYGLQPSRARRIFSLGGANALHIQRMHVVFIQAIVFCRDVFASILAEGAIALSVTLSGGALFAS